MHVVFFVLVFSVLYFWCCIKSTSIFVKSSSTICLEGFWSESKKESFSLGFENRTDLLPYNLPVFISKLSECNQVGFSAAFLADFDNFLVPINDTF